ncbi:serine/arginine repetitive matrix protein 1-like [Pyrgilauda ruficollis]|uniref:serine/arginine repetitive matrix protein 1-like n=1 Tax=Pyrgilauda ruficollis TaxID=221976 RepID=UPI001B871827|nr:serine/arginine repetitive matrix protein 1-like [Pyrgilauda ruficollis]
MPLLQPRLNHPSAQAASPILFPFFHPAATPARCSGEKAKLYKTTRVSTISTKPEKHRYFLRDKPPALSHQKSSKLGQMNAVKSVPGHSQSQEGDRRMQQFAGCPHPASAAYEDRRCRLNGAARPRAASPLSLAHLARFSPAASPRSAQPAASSAARLHQPLLQRPAFTLRQPRPEGAPPPPAPPKGRRGKTQTPPEGRRRGHGPGVFEGPQARRGRLSTAAAAQQRLPAVLLGAPCGPDGGCGRRSAARPPRGEEARPVHPGHGAGPGRADRQHPLRAAATRKRKKPHADRPPSIPSKAPPRGSLTNRVRGGGNNRSTLD